MAFLIKLAIGWQFIEALELFQGSFCLGTKIAIYQKVGGGLKAGIQGLLQILEGLGEFSQLAVELVDFIVVGLVA